MVYCSWGSGIAVGFSGSRTAVQIKCNQLYNYQATDSDPIWQNDNEEGSFAYVLSDWSRLERGLTAIFENTMDKMNAKTLAKQVCSTLPSERFLTNSPAIPSYQIGHNSQDNRASEE